MTRQGAISGRYAGRPDAARAAVADTLERLRSMARDCARGGRAAQVGLTNFHVELLHTSILSISFHPGLPVNRAAWDMLRDAALDCHAAPSQRNRWLDVVQALDAIVAGDIECIAGAA